MSIYERPVHVHVLITYPGKKSKQKNKAGKQLKSATILRADTNRERAEMIAEGMAGKYTGDTFHVIKMKASGLHMADCGEWGWRVFQEGQE